MATKTIDIAFHGSSFPTSYVGPGTLIGNVVQSNPANRISGYFTGTGEAVNIPLGFSPTKVKVVDVTNTLVWEWFRGFPATNTLKTLAGTTGANDTVTTAVDTGSAIVVTVDYSGNGSVALSATLAATDAKLIFVVEG